MKYPAQVDVAVLMLFFNRADTFKLVFDEVKKARPSKLFLYQDGPRNEQDLPKIEECRQIVSDENIDWKCEVHRNYLTHNQGCDPSGFRSHKWALSLTDKVIILEDDVVPSQSFFPFCKELLDRYENDERISMIAGFNTDEITTDVPYDYFFTSFPSIWGWATWRRVADQWDDQYLFMKDDYHLKLMKTLSKKRGYRNTMIPMFQDHSQSGKEYFETINWANMILNSGLCIMPQKNLINNIGLTTGSTHYAAKLQAMPKKLRRIFTMSRYELDFPLHHPKYVIEHVDYMERRYKVMGWNHPFTKIGYSLEELWYNLLQGDFSYIYSSLTRRIRKWMGKDRHV